MTTTLLPLDQLVVDPCNPRRDVGDVTDLAASIRVDGIRQPLVVRKLPSGLHGVVEGQRRLTAARIVGRADAPCVVRQLDDQEALVHGTSSNAAARALDPIDEAVAYQRLRDDHGLSLRQIADRVGVSSSTVTKRIQLLDLHRDDQEAVRAGSMSLDEAYRLVKDPRRSRRYAPHGTRNRYAAGCRCGDCTDANTARRRQQRAGSPAATPSALPADLERTILNAAQSRGVEPNVWLRRTIEVEAAHPRCADCPALALAGGQWCYRHFRQHANPAAGAAGPAGHGTPARARRHYREEGAGWVCQPCREAAAAYQRERAAS